MAGELNTERIERATPPPVLSFVLPSHNEISLLGSTVTNLVTGLEGRGFSYEIVIVENGSTDGSLRLARMLAAQLDQVRLLHLPIGDYGAALAAGFGAARGEIVVNFDVDYYDLAFLDAALAILRDPQIAMVLASKRAPGASDRRPLHRRLLTAGFAAALRLLLDLETSDAHGMKAMRHGTVAPVVAEVRLRKSLFDVELVVRGDTRGLEVRELPASVVERRPPRTGIAQRAIEGLIGAVHLRLLLGPAEKGDTALGAAAPRLRRLARRLGPGHRSAPGARR